MVASECPSCTKMIEVGKDPKIGQRVYCSECETHMEVVWLEPVELDWPVDDDDFEYDDEEYEDLMYEDSEY